VIQADVYKKGELFYEPPKLYPEQDFEVDGIKVHFEYITDTMPHFEFYGLISETGYISSFPKPEHLDEYGVKGAAENIIKNLKTIFQSEQEKLKRKKARGKTNGN